MTRCELQLLSWPRRYTIFNSSTSMELLVCRLLGQALRPPTGSNQWPQVKETSNSKLCNTSAFKKQHKNLRRNGSLRSATMRMLPIEVTTATRSRAVPNFLCDEEGLELAAPQKHLKKVTLMRMTSARGAFVIKCSSSTSSWLTSMRRSAIRTARVCLLRRNAKYRLKCKALTKMSTTRLARCRARRRMIGMRRRVNERLLTLKLAWRTTAESTLVTESGWTRPILTPLPKLDFSQHWTKLPTRLRSGELKMPKDSLSWRRSSARNRKKRHAWRKSRLRRRREKVRRHNIMLKTALTMTRGREESDQGS